ncbi:glycosyltransferase [Caproicibacter fermentans]|uniref:Glycosyltransferase n=1 Tax=Caproicibacter fermentans TaxID=2576756 RepID=A0A7G8TCZ6_9FIRM|nr:glycosyltransferase [Caproicibacter fermentans]QNK41487.1 glycosyltransferase [Caproicibacter fermentans]
MKLLLLLTSTFPFDGGEEFLENELRYASGFDKILVCPCGLKENSVKTRSLPQGIEWIPLKRAAVGRAEYASLFRLPCVRAELFDLMRTKRLSIARAHETLFFMKNAMSIFQALIREELILSADDVTVYSYWFYDAAAAGALLAEHLRAKGKIARLVSRAHGFDIHEERSAHRYLPMRSYLLKSAAAVFPCSNEGAGILRSRYPQYAGKVRTAHLGTPDEGCRGGCRTEFHLVSCSYMVPVKRLPLIAEALRKADFPMKWTHIGSGPMEGELKRLAKSLPPCVRVEFPGAMKNADVLDFYKQQEVSVFVNVSSSEGIPVSIMEACSFGFPVIATDVGGTGEIVKDGQNGFLLKAEFDPSELLGMLEHVRAMEEENYEKLCGNSRSIWRGSFSAERNYPEFYEVLSR